MIRFRRFVKFNQCGFTFNELMVAMALGVAVVMSTALNTASMFRHQTASSNHTIALQLAQDKLEELQARLNLADENRCPGGGDIGVSASGTAGGRFDRCWRIEPSPLGPHLKRIDVTVSWRDFQTREMTLSVLLFAGS